MIVVLAILLLAALFGTWLAIGVARGSTVPMARFVGPIHGLVGAAGLAGLMILHVPHHALAALGLGSFVTGAKILLASALLLGILIVLAALRGRRTPGFLVGAHATLAISGIVLVLAIVSLGA